MTLSPLTFVHGTAVAFGPHAILLRGPSGAGKSDLALRLLTVDTPSLTLVGLHQGRLIADDQVHLEPDVADGAAVRVSAPEAIRAQLEVRGVGIIRVPVCVSAILHLVIDLVPLHDIPRCPDDARTVLLSGHAIPSVKLHAFEASAPLKCLLALAGAVGSAPGSRNQ